MYINRQIDRQIDRYDLYNDDNDIHRIIDDSEHDNDYSKMIVIG